MNINDPEFFYQDTASTVVDSIISLFNQGIKKFESYDQWVYDVPISNEEEDYRHFNWRYEVCRSETKEDFEYDFFGLAGRDYYDEPSIEIRIVLPRGRHQKKVLLDRAELFDVVAHELHHLAQNIENNSYNKKTSEKGRLSYFLDPYEIEAFHIGIRAHAALTGKSFREVASKYIKKSWEEGTDAQIERVLDAWMNTKFGAFANNFKNSRI